MPDKDHLNDVERAILQTLMNDADLNALVAGQIYPSHLASLNQSLLTFPMVTFRGAGSPSPTWNEVFFPQTYQTTCWSKKSYSEALEVAGAARIALNGKRLAFGNSVILVKVQNLGQSVFDPSASLHYVSTQIRVNTLDLV